MSYWGNMPTNAKRGFKLFGWIGAGVNFGYGVKKGLQGEKFTTQDVFNPFETVGKAIGRVIHTNNQFAQERGRGDIEVSLLQQRALTPPFTTNIRTPPNLSEMTRITNTGSSTGPRNE